MTSIVTGAAAPGDIIDEHNLQNGHHPAARQEEQKDLPLCLLLQPAVQNYAWGVKGTRSSVAGFLEEHAVEDEKPYAELWMGTHVNGMAQVLREKTRSTVRRTTRSTTTTISSSSTSLRSGTTASSSSRGEVSSLASVIEEDPDYWLRGTTTTAAARRGSSSASINGKNGNAAAGTVLGPTTVAQLNHHAGNGVVAENNGRDEHLHANGGTAATMRENHVGNGTKTSMATATTSAAADSIPPHDLSFLFKVLSVSTALSIQLHPDKPTAQRLFREHPDIYKDANHKPEIAIPLGPGPFEALMGFRPEKEIRAFLELLPELQEACSGVQTASTASSKISELYAALMRQDGKKIAALLDSLVKRIEVANAENEDHFLDDKLKKLVLRLNHQYPNDVGIFSVFFLNYVIVDNHVDTAPATTDGALISSQAADEPDERRLEVQTAAVKLGKSKTFLFCKANVPHAYLNGNCVECMALSDNVIRAGLTPKFKDVDLLLKICDYSDDLVETGECVRSSELLGGVGGRGGEKDLKTKTGPKSIPDQDLEEDGVHVHLYRAPPPVFDFQVLEIVALPSRLQSETKVSSGRIYLPTASIMFAIQPSSSGGSLRPGPTAAHGTTIVEVEVAGGFGNTVKNNDQEVEEQPPESEEFFQILPGQTFFLRGDVFVTFSFQKTDYSRTCDSQENGTPAGPSVFLATSGETAVTMR
ncbi:unnamed protein product [Amoebophrya sp. A120]|nr:unnamed protein product [Amoebophrya sp. A120]|eukprot:GSA120T00010683001.1